MRPHLDTEKYLDECVRKHQGFAYTVIREGLYAESFPVYTAQFDPKHPVDEIRIPHDGSGPGIAWVKRDELGEGSAELIARFAKDPTGFRFRNQTVLLSGLRTLTLRETVDILAKIARRPVRICQVSGDEFAAQPQVSQHFIHHGVNYSKDWPTVFEGIRRGEAATVSPLLQELLGREPEGFERIISETYG